MVRHRMVRFCMVQHCTGWDGMCVCVCPHSLRSRTFFFAAQTAPAVDAIAGSATAIGIISLEKGNSQARIADMF